MHGVMKKLIFAACLACLSPVADAAIPALTPVERTDMPYIAERWNEKKKEIAAGGAKVVFIGDSITHFWENHGGAAYGKCFFPLVEKRGIAWEDALKGNKAISVWTKELEN